MKSALLLATLYLAIHSFYFSVTKINHNPEVGSLEITMNFFTDDLNRALEIDQGQRIRLGTRKEADSTDIFLEEYIRDHSSYSIDSVQLHYEFIGKEVQMEQTYVYLEILDIDSIEHLSVQSTLLKEVSKKQVNEFRLQSNEKIKSIQLSQAQSQGTITLSEEK